MTENNNFLLLFQMKKFKKAKIKPKTLNSHEGNIS